MEWKIVVDTACDFREIPNKAENVIYERVPFSLQIEDKVFVDTLDLDIDGKCQYQIRQKIFQ